MITLEWVKSDSDLHDCWHYVRPGIETILRKNPGNYLPEDVFHSLKTGASLLGLFEDSETGEWVAFIVLTKVDGNDGLQWFVWCFYNTAGNQAIQDNWALVLDWCKATGARRIITQSIRPGWAKFGEKLGFKVSQIQYQLDL